MATLYCNGIILTQDSKQPIASSFLVDYGKITAVGKDQDFNLSGITKVDLNRQVVLPGFNDAHIHLWKVGQLDSFILDLRGIGSIELIQNKVKEAAKKSPEGAWIIGRGFNESVLSEKRLPIAFDLDQAAPNHPVYLLRTCAHIAVVNSAAMRTCGLSMTTTCPDGGRFGQQDGALNGQLFENALGLITRHLPRTNVVDYQAMIRNGAQKMLSHGITSITDPAVHPELMDAYNLTAGPELGLRLNLMPMMMPDGGDKTYPLPDIYFDEWKRITTAKLFADGGLSGATAALSRNYKNTSDKGILRISRERFFELATVAREKGYRMGIHAIGDRAIQQVLDVYEHTNKLFGPIRNRIEHFGLPTDVDLKRTAELEVVAVPQTIFLDELGENFLTALDEDYLNRCYPIRTLIKNNIRFALSTDAPVVKNFNPWKNISVAMTRKTAGGHCISPEESITIEQAIYAYTMGGAYAEGTEDVKGSITAGKFADFIVVDRDPRKVTAEEMPEIQITQTFVNGTEVITS